jgi:hypothetical protein
MTLHLINDDNPDHFPPSAVTVTRKGLSVGTRQAIGVAIDPPVPDLESGPLAEAILVSRRETEIETFLSEDPSRGLSVYVCRYSRGPIATAPKQLTKEDLRIEIWGLLASGSTRDIYRR